MAENKDTNSKDFLNTLEDPAGLNSTSDGSEYYLRKNRHLRITCSQVKDEVDGMFAINFKQELPQFNTAFGKAYSVTHKFGAGEAAYAITLDKKYPIRLAEINKLAAKTFDHMVNILAAQVVPSSASKGRVFAVIIERPSGITLAEYINKNGAVNPDYLTRTLIPAIGVIIAELQKMGITHGRINTNNIYLDEAGKITVGECISEPCGYSQPIIYETLNRATAMPIGKGNGNETVDYNALGVLAAILLRGKDITEGVDQEEVLARKFEEGTYKIVTSGIDMQPQMLDFFRGMLANRKNEVWGLNQLQEWVRGRRFNLLPPADSIEDNRPIAFNGVKYTSRKYLVHKLYINWDEGKKFVQKDNIIRWISRNPNDNELIERLELASGHYGKERTAPGFDDEDETLAQYILLLDPTGPIRLRDFSANIDGLGCALADAFARNNTHNLHSIENIISHNLQLLTHSKAPSSDTSLQEATNNLQKCIELLRKKDYGFGIERCLYELNKALPCQSPILLEDLTFTNEELLRTIDENESVGGKIIDKQMAAFISERLDLQMRVHLSALTRFPEFTTNIYIQALALLSLAQQTCNVGALPKLSAKICDSLKGVTSILHSKTIRVDLEENLKKTVNKGVLSNILRIITNPKYLVRDRIGFKKATNIYKNNAIQIVKLSNAKVVNNVGYRYGLQLAVMISFFIATIEIITLVIKAF